MRPVEEPGDGGCDSSKDNVWLYERPDARHVDARKLSHLIPNE